MVQNDSSSSFALFDATPQHYTQHDEELSHQLNDDSYPHSLTTLSTNPTDNSKLHATNDHADSRTDSHTSEHIATEKVLPTKTFSEDLTSSPRLVPPTQPSKAWRGIVGQYRIQRVLSKALLSNRIAHAYLFWGASGIGKDALALEFAKVLNCPHRFIVEDIIHACQTCPSCLQAQRLEHPNISLVFSLPAGKASGVADSASPLLKMSDEQIAVIREQMQKKAENPYHHIDIPGATQIRINAMRDIKRSLSLAQFTEGKRVIIITDADAMNPEAANTFLKTLEEPSQNAVFILTTSNKERVLPTILSRCQQLRCSTLAEEEITQGILERFNVEIDHARSIAQLADGSFAKALALIDEDTQSLHAEMMEWLRAILRRQTYQIATADCTQIFSEKKDRTFVEKLLTTLLFFLRTAYPIALRHRQNEIMTPTTDAERFAINFSHGHYEEALSHVEQAIRVLRVNANLHLLLLSVSLKLRSCFI